MNLKFHSHLSAIGLGLIGAFAGHVAGADVTLHEKMMVEGTGMMAMANMSGTTTSTISGNRSRVDSEITMQNRMARMFARGAGNTSEIIRLDQDKVFEVNNAKKTYTETSLADRRAQMAKALEDARAAQAKQPSPTGMDESECEWSEPKAEVKKTGAKANIAGFDAEQLTVVASQSCKDKKTGAVCDFALEMDSWIAPGLEANSEVTKFYQAYAQQMGLTRGNSRDFSERAEAMFGRYKGIWQEVAAKMSSVKGTPVRSSFAMGFGGPQCAAAQQAQSLPPAPTAGSMGSAAASGAGQMAGQAVGSKVGDGAFGGIAGQIGGKLAGGLFNRKKKQEEAAQPAAAAETAAPAAASSNGLITPLRITTELISITKDGVDASTFEVPAGFKKVANNT